MIPLIDQQCVQSVIEYRYTPTTTICGEILLNNNSISIEYKQKSIKRKEHNHTC
jgi:hypothetical protein